MAQSMAECNWSEKTEKLLVDRRAFRKPKRPTDKAVDNTNQQVYDRDKIRIWKVVVDLLIQNVENDIEEIPHEEKEACDQSRVLGKKPFG